MRTLRIKEVTLKAGDGSSLFEFTYFISRDVSNHVSLSDSVGRGLSQVLSVGGESCLLSSDGVRDSAGYGHRSILNHALLCHEKYRTLYKKYRTLHGFIDTARQQIVALPGIPGGVTGLLAGSCQ